MYRIVVADDEERILEGIESLIDWEALNSKIVFSANNGYDVKEYLSVHRADILITDIRMPALTGMELAQWIHENKIPTRVIFLTAYSDFQYAKQAMAYKVEAYVLKDDYLEELETTVKELIETMASESVSQEEVEVNQDKLIADVCALIKEKYTSDITLATIAKEMNVSAGYLSRRFSREKGCSITDYINKYRVKKAADLLQSTNMFVYEVAVKVGIEDSSYFSALFKKYMGISPQKYKK